ncbi:MAG: hypothetical protein DRJ51_01370 [Thermoprotei archaeon]|nr:MAG: hypothetical protein DRJ51_01370 [Thermoprotei archaeon]RLE82823.1 MAG: hypothetical protein DRJ36_00245 [Thermoprotei archaeon]
MRVKVFGWRGFTFRIPETWELVHEKIGKKDGAFRIEDEYGPRMELSWERVPFTQMPEPKESFEKMLKAMKKKNQNLKSTGRREVQVYGHDGIASRLSFDEEHDAVVLHWYCEKSERLCTLFLYTLRKEYEKYSAIFNDIHRSLKCHGEKNFWYFYGFKMVLPNDFKLVYYRVTTGLSVARFYRKKDNSYIILSYNGMANILLKEYYSSLEDWYSQVVRKDVEKLFGKFRKVSEESTVIGGHATKLLIYEKGIPLPLVKTTRRLRVALWKCDQTNRLYSFVTIFSEPKKGEEVPSEEILRSIYCH